MQNMAYLARDISKQFETATLSVFNPHAMEGIREGVAEASWPE